MREKDRQKAAINENDFVLSVIDNVRQLLGKQANVERVNHTSKARNTKEEF